MGNKNLKDIDQFWTLFLDRDGVLNERPINDYVKSPEEFVFIPGVLESLKLLNEKFGLILIVTNQQGVGLGKMTIGDLDGIHQKMLEMISMSGGRIDKIYTCTDIKTTEQNCRKPNLSMAFTAKNDFPSIDFSRSVMVGDTESDITFGEKAGMITVQVGDEAPVLRANFHFPCLLDFSEYIDY